MLPIETPDLRYHQAIFQLLEIEPIVDPQAQQIIAIREGACQTTFPDSIKEWFSMKSVDALFHRHTNQDHLVDIYELGPIEQVDYGYLGVAMENQGSLFWFALLDGSDDPPIFHDFNQYPYRDFGLIDWNSCLSTFAAFIFDMLSYRYGRVHLSVEDETPNDFTLAALRSRYTEGPFTNLPEGQKHRFFNKHGLVTVDSRDSETEGKARWGLQAKSERSFLQLVESVRYFHTLEQSLGIKD